MKNLDSLLICFCSLFSTTFADVFEKDTKLVEKLQKNNVRLIIVCCFQATNNVIDIVTASPSPGYELTSYGLALLNDSIPSFASENVSHIYTSPLFRAQQATNLIGKSLNLTTNQLSIDSRLTMQNFGAAEGEDFDDYKKNFDSELALLEDSPPNGEPGVFLFNRTHDFLLSLEYLQDQTVMIITHAFNYCHISKCLTGKYGHLPELGSFTIYDFNQIEAETL